MGRRKRNYGIKEDAMNNYLDNEELNEDMIGFSDNGENTKISEDDLTIEATNIPEWKNETETKYDFLKYTEVIVPIIGKTADNKAILEYNGYGIMTDVMDSDASSITLRVFGTIGTTDFRFEVV